ncbi:LAFA_0E12662g1_1 [Lachancea sp. 'fantastica']|nr:LAFA_0E12662g1_1 [Lachancea sp. 'fantastica']
MNCSVCLLEPARYTCPKCGKKTCSLACVKAHKAQDNCSGTVSSTATYLAREDLKAADTSDGSNLLVQRDYNYLLGMNRQLELLKRDGKQKNKRALAPAHSYNNQAHHKRQQRSESQPHVIRRGVCCALLPKGMQRAVQNKSRWDKNLDLFVWSIEWCVLSPQGTIEIHHTSHRNKETDPLAECVGKVVQAKCNELFSSSSENQNSGQDPNQEQALHQDHPANEETECSAMPKHQDEEISTGLNTKDSSAEPPHQEIIKQAKMDWISLLRLQFFIKWYPRDSDIFGDPKKLIPLDPTRSIGELFRDKVVVEYPTIYISQEGCPLGNGFSLVNQNPSTKALAQSSSEDSTASSDSDSSSSDSSSDSDEEPPEASSRVVPAPGTNFAQPPTNAAPTQSHQATSKSDNSDDDDEDDYTPGISLDFLAD